MTDDPNVKFEEAKSPTVSSDQNHQPSPPVLRSELQIPETLIDKYDSQQAKNARNERWKLRLEVGTFLAVVAYATVAGYQGCKMREAADATRISADAARDAVQIAKNTLKSGNESFSKTLTEMQAQSKAMRISADAATDSNRITLMAARNEQRAWLGPEETVKPTPQELEKGGKAFLFGVKIKNVGRTPALEVKTETALRFLPPGAKFEPIYTYTPNEPESVTVIFPDSRGTPTAPPVDLSQQQIAALKQGKMILYLFGRVEYRDTARQVHHTTFCFWLLQPDLGRFGACDTYNSAD